jgi:hypothetical protein
MCKHRFGVQLLQSPPLRSSTANTSIDLNCGSFVLFDLLLTLQSDTQLPIMMVYICSYLVSSIRGPYLFSFKIKKFLNYRLESKQRRYVVFNCGGGDRRTDSLLPIWYIVPKATSICFSVSTKMCYGRCHCKICV